MNRSYDQFHIVNSYGVFGSVTKKRYEIIIQGTNANILTEDTIWKEYELPCKPGNVFIMPCIRAPFHYRITWQIWFAAMGSYQHNPWLVHWVYKILHGNKLTLSLLETNPFGNLPPTFIKADLYLYKFNKPGPEWYKRELINIYLPPLSKNHLGLQKFILQNSWPPGP